MNTALIEANKIRNKLIQKAYEGGEPYKEMAARFKICEGTISYLAVKYSWKRKRKERSPLCVKCNKNKRHGKDSYCRPCRNKVMREYKEKNPRPQSFRTDLRNKHPYTGIWAAALYDRTPRSIINSY